LIPELHVIVSEAKWQYAYHCAKVHSLSGNLQIFFRKAG
jgi:hypothetical protein